MNESFRKLSCSRKIQKAISLILMLFFSVIAFALSTFSYNSLKLNPSLIADTFKNWQSPTITDFIVSKNGTCPAGYEPAIESQWAGTNEGCDCSQISLKYITGNTCVPIEISRGCLPIPAYEPRPLKNWGKIGNDFSTFCLKKSKETWADLGPSQGTSCPQGQRKCGMSDDFVFCTSEAVCPVTSITFNGQACPTCYLFDGSTSGHMKYIKVSRGEDKLPMAQVKLNEDNICFNSDLLTKSPWRSYYFLYKRNTYDCSNEAGDLWNKVGDISEAGLFRYNALSDITTSLTTYGYYANNSVSSSIWWHLYSRSYVPWKIQCRGMMVDFMIKSTRLEEVRFSHFISKIVTIVTVFTFGVAMSFIEIMNLTGYGLPFLRGKNEEKQQKILKLKGLLQLGSKIIILPVQVWAFVVLMIPKGVLDYAVNNACSSDTVNLLLSKSTDSLDKAFKSDLGGILSLAVFFVLSIIQLRRERNMLENEQNQIQAQDNLRVVVHDFVHNDDTVLHNLKTDVSGNNSVISVPRNTRKVSFAVTSLIKFHNSNEESASVREKNPPSILRSVQENEAQNPRKEEYQRDNRKIKSQNLVGKSVLIPEAERRRERKMTLDNKKEKVERGHVKINKAQFSNTSERGGLN